MITELPSSIPQSFKTHCALRALRNNEVRTFIIEKTHTVVLIQVNDWHKPKQIFRRKEPNKHNHGGLVLLEQDVTFHEQL